MKSNHILKLRAGTALRALALIGATAGAAAFAAPAVAQDYTSGAIAGTVTNDAGEPVSGATVTVTSTGTGISRTSTTGAGGNFRFGNLLPGSYDLTVQAAGLAPYRATAVPILASQSANIPVMLSSGAEEIVVTGTRAVQAFTGNTVGLTVDVEDFIKDKPLGRNLQSIIQLTPGTVAGNSTNSTFNGLSALGGSSVAENAYYINGLNITNFDNYLGSATVPFYFYKSVEVKTGGYQAEYGRATGGIVNAVTKAGSNDFVASAHIDWAPQFLRSPGRNTQSYTGVGASGFQNNSANEFDRADSLLAAIEAGGPIIKDRLFIYGMVQFQNTSSIVNGPLTNTAVQRRNNDPFWGVKVDAYPLDSQHLEFTIFDTRNTTTRYDRSYSLNPTTGMPTYGAVTSILEQPRGGVNFVGKYTGTFTDWLTVSGAYGRVRDRFDNQSIAAGSDVPYFTNAAGVALYGVPNGGFYTPQRVQLVENPYNTEREFYRADVDLSFSLLGDHHVRVGYDRENNSLGHVSVTSGGAFEFNNGFISSTAYNAQLGGAGARLIARAPDAIGPIVEINYYNTGGAFEARNEAYYIQDEWKPFDRLTLSLGVRRDDFLVNKPSGKPMVDLPKNYAPRLGFQYNLWGDRSGRAYGSYGWYYLPVASNTAYRQGAPSYYFRQRYHFTGVGANGLPILSSLVTNNGTYQSACPFALVPGGALTNCSVTGDGADINTTQGVDANLKATRESEFILGYEHKAGLWTFGLRYTHRNLDRTAEDSSIDAAVNAYCAANNVQPHAVSATGVVSATVTPCSTIFSGYHQYVINNPGNPITVNLLAGGYDINNRTVTFTAAQLGYGGATRKYDAVTLSVNRRFDGLFSFGGSYTWSKSRGNSEGYVQSDFGQVDAGITQDFDQPGFQTGASGLLPNDRRHEFKFYGSVSPTEDFTLGFNTRLLSPAPLSCFGYNPTDSFANGYDQASHYCGLKLSPRGTAGKTDWYQSIDLSARLNVHFAGRTFTLRGDVFNLLNSQSVLNRNQIGDLAVTTYNAAGLPTAVAPNPSYNQPNLYQAPRFVRIGADISF